MGSSIIAIIANSTNLSQIVLILDGKRWPTYQFDRLHAVPLNESESFFYKILVEMRIINTTSVVKHINEKSQPEKCSDEAYGMIVIDMHMHGRLANNLFEVAFAKRITDCHSSRCRSNSGRFVALREDTDCRNDALGYHTL
jgi:hypothetical protein